VNPEVTIPQAQDRVLSTLERDGSRRWLYPRLSKGRFWSHRRTIAYILLAMFTLVPFMRVGGRPVILLDLARRHFTLLGVTFLPTDTALLALFVLIVLLSVFFVTAMLGRVWCGWACPQTVYMEYVFRPVERLCTGRSGKGGTPMKDVAAWRKVAMYVAYLLICLHLANTFLAYFVPANVLNGWITSSPTSHPAGFVIVVIITALMLFNFGWFREQTCIIACPYGRLQSVLLDKQSLIISYDTARGEPRTKAKRTAISLPVMDRSGGDCVDCSLCVQVCPTGIDIRDGLQVECVACAQCIDACDAVMDKINRPRGLIRYSSQSAMAGERQRILRPRVIIYSAIIVVLVVLLAVLLATRSPADVALLRNVGRPFVVGTDGMVENTMRIHITNRTERPQHYRVATTGVAEARALMEHETLTVAAGESITEPVRVLAPANEFTLGHLDVTLRISGDDGLQIDRPCRLLGPASMGALSTGVNP
jgi:cytochrome c oxidase accessory protein FixG